MIRATLATLALLGGALAAQAPPTPPGPMHHLCPDLVGFPAIRP